MRLFLTAILTAMLTAILSIAGFFFLISSGINFILAFFLFIVLLIPLSNYLISMITKIDVSEYLFK